MSTPLLLYCPRCRAGNKFNSRFCRMCRYELQQVTLCPSCGSPTPGHASRCNLCRNSLASLAPIQPSVPVGQSIEQLPAVVKDRRQLYGMTGSLALFVGVFTPIVSAPIVGSLNYFQNGRGDGVIILLLAVVGLIASMVKAYKLLLLSGIASLALLLFTFFNLQYAISQIQSQFEKDLAGSPFRGLGEIALRSVQIQWGWAVLHFGAVLLIVAGVARPKT